MVTRIYELYFSFFSSLFGKEGASKENFDEKICSGGRASKKFFEKIFQITGQGINEVSKSRFVSDIFNDRYITKSSFQRRRVAKSNFSQLKNEL